MRPQWIALMAVVALAASACSMSAHGAAPPSPPTSMPDSGTVPPPAPQASFVITYPRGIPARSAARVHTPCPAVASCAVHELSAWHPHVWVLVVTRHLTCAPAAGQYQRPQNACRALRNLQAQLAKKHGYCSCPLEIEPAAKAVGTDHGRRTVVPLDSCTACGLGKGAFRDLQVLTPA